MPYRNGGRQLHIGGWGGLAAGQGHTGIYLNRCPISTIFSLTPVQYRHAHIDEDTGIRCFDQLLKEMGRHNEGEQKVWHGRYVRRSIGVRKGRGMCSAGFHSLSAGAECAALDSLSAGVDGI